MATHFEVFDKLRDLGRSLDKISHTLPADDNTEETNKARACLHLRALLTEAKNFKEESSKGIADAKSRQKLDDVLMLCEKQACKIREDIENLENHLAKYGYKKPAEKLPEVSVVSSEEFDNENGDQCNSENSQSSSSDKENHSPASEHGAIVENTEVADKLGSTKESQPKEVDWLATPVRPATFTKLLSPSPLRNSQPENSGLSTPESLELPRQPTTQTPMIKAAFNFDSPPDDNDNTENSTVDDFPSPPTFATPGLKLYGKKADKTNADSVETSMHYDPLNTPPPPNVTTVRRLNPDDLCLNSAKSASPAEVEPAVHIEEPNDNRTYEFPDISYEMYETLPDSVQRQFPFKQINLLIGQTETYLNTRTKVNSTVVTDEELTSVLQLGPFTRAFALAMLKLDYFTVKRSGIYSVHDKMIA